MDVKPTPLSYLSSQSGNGSRPTALMFAVSALGHMLFLLLLILAPSQIPAQRYRPSVIQVSMVSVPSPGTGPGPAPAPMVTAEAEVSAPVTAAPRKTAPQPAGIPVVRPEPVKPPADEAVVSTATRSEPETAPDIISVAPKKEKVKTKVSLKKKTLRSAQVIQRAIKQIEEKSEAPRPKRVADAIDKPQDEVGTGAEKTTGPSSPVEQAIAQLRDRVEAGVGRPGGQGGGGGRPGLPGNQVLEQIDLYKLEIAYHIEKRWAFSEHLAGGRTDLESVLVIKILPNGEIQDIWFEKKSGNNYFDDSVFKAIQKSNPLPPLPKEYHHPFYTLGLVFTPSGLRKGTG